MNDIEKEYIDDLPEENNYPALKTIAVISSVIGKALFGLAMLWLAVFIYSLADTYFRGLKYPSDIDTLEYIFLLMPFLMFFIGFQFVLISEMIRLAIDLQGNADRQSILLTLILNRMVEGKP